MTAKIQMTDAFKSVWDNSWHLQANIGPFSSPEKANEFAKKIMALVPEDDPELNPVSDVVISSKAAYPNGEQFP